MAKKVVELKEYMPVLPETISPKGSLTLGIIVRQACCALWNSKTQPFYSAAVSVDPSTSPSGAVWYDKSTVVDQIIDHIQTNELDQGLELPIPLIYARFADWARANNISRRQLMADLNLRRKQDFWENPRNIAILVGAVAAIVATVAGLAGYKFGSTPAPAPIIINLPAQK